MVNKKYPIEIQILTPLSIGTGGENEWANGVDYVQKNNNVYVLNMQKIVDAGIEAERLSYLFVNGDTDGIVRLLTGKLDTISDKVFSLSVSSNNPIKTTLKNELYGTPLIAGSSLKGAIRSILFSYFRSDENGKTAEEKVFGSLKAGEEFGRFIKFSDVEFHDTQLYNSKIYNLRLSEDNWTGGWKHEMRKTTGSFISSGFNTIYECVEPGEKGVGTIMLSDKSFDLFHKYVQTEMPYFKKKEKLIHSDIRTLFEIINNHTRAYLHKEKEFFETFSAENSDKIVDSIDELIYKIPTNNSSCILKMSAGSGFHSITGDWQYDDYTDTGEWEASNRNAGKLKYKSRKIILDKGRFDLMGFVQISLISEKEYASACDQMVAIHNARMTSKNAELLERKRIIDIAIQKKQEDLANYTQLIKDALEAEEQDNYILAKEKATEASKLLIGENKHDAILDRVGLKAIDQQTKIDIAKKEATIDEGRKRKVAEGLAVLDEKFNMGPNEGKYKVTSLKVCLQKVESYMKAAKITQLEDNEKQKVKDTVKRVIAFPPKGEVKDIKNGNSKLWQKLTSIIGKDLCDTL